MSRVERTRRINEGVHKWLSDQSHCIFVREIGVDTALVSQEVFSGRLDFLAWKHRLDLGEDNESGLWERFIGIEVKSCAADYQSDKKWSHYLKFCHQFYFAVDRKFPIDLIDRSTGAGILLIEHQGQEFGWYKARIIRRAKLRIELGANISRDRLIFLIARRLFHLNERQEKQ